MGDRFENAIARIRAALWTTAGTVLTLLAVPLIWISGLVFKIGSRCLLRASDITIARFSERLAVATERESAAHERLRAAKERAEAARAAVHQALEEEE